MSHKRCQPNQQGIQTRPVRGQPIQLLIGRKQGKIQRQEQDEQKRRQPPPHESITERLPDPACPEITAKRPEKQEDAGQENKYNHHQDQQTRQGKAQENGRLRLARFT
ncbi:MAG: hypothetical protein ACOYYU_08625 [Chloroflexota bacterium]